MNHWEWLGSAAWAIGGVEIKRLLRATNSLIAGSPGLEAIGSDPAKHIGSQQQCADDRPRRCFKRT